MCSNQRKEFYFLTIFPDQVNFYLSQSIPSIAQRKNKVSVHALDIRQSPKQQIDDYAYGGGTGMVMMVKPIVDVLEKHALLDQHIILLSPRGKTWTQQKAQELSTINKKIVFICGHYEGVDERICDFVTEEISIGDYLLTSGTLSALVIADSIIRLIPDVINSQSLKSESFDNNLLDYPVYTRPFEFHGKQVPEVLLSGNHAKIEEYRQQEKIRVTKKYRPDIYKKFLSKK